MALFTIENLSFTYPGQEKPALSDISFVVEPGEFLVICGKSGCGKTTLLRHLKPALTPYGQRTGTIRYHDKAIDSLTQREQAARIGYVLQNPEHQIVTDKVWHELAFGLENLGYSEEDIRLRVAEMASYFGIEDWFHRPVEELSGGQKQLLNLASVMAMQPEVLVLDEPTAQLDPIAAQDFLATIHKINQELATTVVMIEHRLEEVMPMADQMLVLSDGRLLTGGAPRQVAAHLCNTDLALALPTPVQIYERTGQAGACPLTIREGRSWLSKQYPDPQVRSLGGSGSSYTERSRHHHKSYVLEARELWFRYERDSVDIVRGLSLHVEKGETFCILGGNGAGKSTTLALLARLRRPYRGKVLGEKIRQGMLPQNPQTLFVKDKVYDDLKEIAGASEARIEELMELMQITHLRDAHPYDLSGGEQQRAALAKVMLTDPQLLLLDEPTKGLDGFYKSQLGEILTELKSAGVTIVMVSHDIEFCASYGDTCALMFDGRLVTQQPARTFFQGNSFYTTSANRMSRHLFTDAVTVEDVITLCKMN